jgi:hypothetical protein
MARSALVACIVIALLAAGREAAAAQSCPRDTVTAGELGDAMRTALRAPGGAYDILASTNAMRFQSAVFEALLEDRLAANPHGGSFFIPHDLLWWEFLTVAGLGRADSSKAPIGRLRAFDYHQSIELVYGPVDSIVRAAAPGQPLPLIAANVRYAWPDRPDGARKFTFTDTLSDPRLRATNHQVITMRFLVFEDMMSFEEIRGISGRPLTGVLATIFKVIGDGSAVYARFGISADGQQVLRTKAVKVVSKTVTATIAPGGRATRGVPEGRADLAEMEARLRQPMNLDYYPYTCWQGAS